MYGSNGEVGRHSTSLTGGPTIVVGRKGSFGEVHYSAAPCWPIDTTYYIDADSTTADLRWLFHRMKALPLTQLNRAAAVPGLNREDAYMQQLLLPPIEEQRRIAAMLDAADALRVKRRQALAKLESLTQAIFFDRFGDVSANTRDWPMKPVREFVEGFDTGKSVAAGDGDLASEYRVLKISAVTSRSFRPEESKSVPEGYQPPPGHHVVAGDLLMSRANTTELVGACAYVRSVPKNFLLPDKLWRFVWSEPRTVEPLYVWQVLQSRRVRKDIEDLATGSSGSMKNISQVKFLGLELPVPPMHLQVEYSARVNALWRQGDLALASLGQLDALFASLQQRAFRGEL